MKLFVSKGFVFICFLLVSACSKDKVESEYPDTGPAEYARQIQEKTDLVQRVLSNETFVLTPGLYETHVRYLDTLGRPMALYFLTIDLSVNPKLNLRAAAAANGADLYAKETVRDQLRYNQSDARTVLAAVNGDYWRVNAQEDDQTPIGQPYGLVYLNGTRYKEITRNGRYYFMALLNDREVVIGDKAYYGSVANRITDALGGRYLLLKDGREMPDELNLNRAVEPRTAVGTVSPHRVVFLVVDGRAADHSQGLNMRDLARVYRAIGVRDAINLDGGGSSTLLVRKEAAYELRNRPSDGSERRVANSWTVTLDN